MFVVVVGEEDDEPPRVTKSVIAIARTIAASQSAVWPEITIRGCDLGFSGGSID